MKSLEGRIEIRRLCAPDEFREQLARDVRRGFMASPKSLPPKYFYDQRGSELFERITMLPEYYLTRAETSILERVADDLVGSFRPEEIVEIGSGSSRKTQLLLSALGANGGRRFVPIDVSEDALRSAADRLLSSFPWLEFVGVVGDFERHLARIPRSGRRLVAFLGSTIGNLTADQRVPFLRSVRAMLAEDDRFLLGVDLVKTSDRLHAAYNDAAGVTAEFNKNVLHVLNRELEGNLPVDHFEHRAFYDAKLERIEMRLMARRNIQARLQALDLDVSFRAGEELHTEISCKFRRETVERAFSGAGLALERWITDAPGDFALALGRPAPPRE